jgi:DNA-binding NarL/FixJ family response regulator
MLYANRPKVMVIDDHELFRGGLIGLLEERGIEVVGEASLARMAIDQVTECNPDVVVMDLNMPGMSGFEAIQRLASVAPLTLVLVLTVMADEHLVMDAILDGGC